VIINNQKVGHLIDFFAPIEPSFMGCMILRFVNLDKCTINESNTTFELCYSDVFSQWWVED
jgi:hypothetical protein